MARATNVNLNSEVRTDVIFLFDIFLTVHHSINLSAFKRCMERLLTESDDTRCCSNTILTS
jgi:hypothetical protein